MRWYYASLLGRIQRESILATCFGVYLRGNARDYIGRRIFTFGVWEPDLTRLLMARITPGTSFIDVGANLGYFSALAAACGAQVTAIEAAPEMAERACRNLSFAGPRATVINAAVAAKEGVAELFEATHPTNSGTRSIIGAEQGVHAIVNCAPLSQLVDLTAPGPKIIKIDIEGAERAVLEELGSLIEDGLLNDTMIIAEIAVENRDLLECFARIGCKLAYLSNDYGPQRYSECLDGPPALTDYGDSAPPEPWDLVIVTP